MFRFIIYYKNCYQGCIIIEYWTVNAFHGDTVKIIKKKLTKKALNTSKTFLTMR